MQRHRSKVIVHARIHLLLFIEPLMPRRGKTLSNARKLHRENQGIISIVILRLLKNGKKSLASRLLYKALSLVEESTQTDPLPVLRQALRNITPLVEVKARRIGGSTYQVPIEVSPNRGTILAVRWLLETSKKRSGKGMAFRLAQEIMDAANNTGNTVRKKEETHRMAEANKAFAHFRF